jgi:general secretion pathway protein F
MPTFTYKAMDAHDRFITGEIEAADAGEVSRELQKLGYSVLDSVAAADEAAGKTALSSLFRRPVGRREITVFLRELSLVLRAGLRLDEALLLLAGEEKAGLAAIVRDLRVMISGGASFGEALERYPRLFGPELVAMVRVAEASGNLEGVLESVGEERARTELLLDKVS